MELAESAPDDPAAVDVLLWVVNCGGQTREADRAVERLVRDHVQDPKIMRIGSTPGNSYIAGRRAPAARHRREEPRSRRATRASFALARLLNNEAELIRRMKQNNNGFAASVTIFQGPECARGSPGERPGRAGEAGGVSVQRRGREVR